MTKIITIHSFRGGTGKSNLAANISVILTLMGKRVGILDSDFQCPGQYLLFGLEAKQIQGKNLEEYLLRRNSLRDAIYDMTSVVLPGPHKMGTSSGKLYLIPSSDQPAGITNILQKTCDLNYLNEAIREITRSLNLDFLIVDTHSSLAGETLLPIAIADSLLIVFRPEQQDYQASAVSIDVARRLDVPKISLIANMMPAVFDKKEVKKQAQEALGCPVTEVIPFASEMLALGNGGLFCLRYPKHPITESIIKIAESINGE